MLCQARRRRTVSNLVHSVDKLLGCPVSKTLHYKLANDQVGRAQRTLDLGRGRLEMSLAVCLAFPSTTSTVVLNFWPALIVRLVVQRTGPRRQRFCRQLFDLQLPSTACLVQAIHRLDLFVPSRRAHLLVSMLLDSMRALILRLFSSHGVFDQVLQYRF